MYTVYVEREGERESSLLPDHHNAQAALQHTRTHTHLRRARTLAGLPGACHAGQLLLLMQLAQALRSLLCFGRVKARAQAVSDTRAAQEEDEAGLVLNPSEKKLVKDLPAHPVHDDFRVVRMPGDRRLRPVKYTTGALSFLPLK